jgi:hypothetical protein
MRVQIDCPHGETEEIPNDTKGWAPYHNATVYINDVPHHLALIPLCVNTPRRQVAGYGFTKWFRGMQAIDKPECGYQTIDVDGVPHVACLTPFERY